MAGREDEAEAREGLTHRKVQGGPGIKQRARHPSFEPSSASFERWWHPLQAPLSCLVKRVAEPVRQGSYGGGVCVQMRHRAWDVGKHLINLSKE